MVNQIIQRLKQGKPQEAIALAKRALSFHPNDPALHVNLAIGFEDAGDFIQAERGYRYVLSLWPNHIEASSNLGNLLARLGRPNEAETIHFKSLSLHPNDAYTIQALAFTQSEQGRIEESVANFKRAAELIGTPQAWSTYLSYGLHVGYDADGHRFWAKRFGEALRRKPPEIEWDGKRKLRVGYVGNCFREHPCAYFFEPVLAAHSERVETYLYHDQQLNDATTERLKGLANHWRDTWAYNHLQLAQIIRNDKIDVLVDLTGHKEGSRLVTMAQRPAPVVGTMVGYVADTGVTRNFNVGWAYRPSDDAPPAVAELPAMKNGYITFGSFNRVNKITLQVASVWAGVLRVVPDSRMVVQAPGGEDNTAVRGRLVSAGMPGERLSLVAPQKERVGHLVAAGETVDIALDTWPFNGVATVCDLGFQGIPSVAMETAEPQGQVAAKILASMGIDDLLVGRDSQRYIELASALAGEISRLSELRGSFRARMAPVLDGSRVAKRLEELFFVLAAEPKLAPKKCSGCRRAASV